MSQRKGKRTSTGQMSKKQEKCKVRDDPSLMFAFPFLTIVWTSIFVNLISIWGCGLIDFSNDFPSLLPSHIFSHGIKFADLAELVRTIWLVFPVPSWRAAKYLLVFAVMEAVLLQFVPGKKHRGPVSPAGITQFYKLNGVLCYLITHTLLGLAVFYFKWFSPGLIYDILPEMLSTLCIYVLVFCLFLYIKGRCFPSGPDVVISGNSLFDFWYDFFWGTEIYPHLFGLPLKQYVNCRLGMMGWNVVIFSYAFKQMELNDGSISYAMLVTLTLQTLYIFKFFLWESGYFASIDIMHDRFGYYICWGCLCWITGLYTISSLGLVRAEGDILPWQAAVLFVVGVAALLVNYSADLQRQSVRATNGNCLIWGAKPKVIHAKYTTEDGKERTNLLLYSGWWGVSRHFHYLPELLLAYSWGLPNGFAPLPQSYQFFLTLLLFDRARRDEQRCSKKYGKYWKQYTDLVPSKIIPFIY